MAQEKLFFTASIKKITTFVLLSVVLYSISLPFAFANGDDDHGDDKITICHATHSEKNPYVRITISQSALHAHDRHQDDEDIIPAPASGCPGENASDNGGGYHDDGDNYGHDGDHNGGNHDGDNHDNDNNHSGENECKNTPPTVILLGNNPISIHVGTNYTDPGATANDKEDGDLTSHIVTTGVVDTSTIGTYTITYTVTDSGGLSDSETRTVNVVANNPQNTNGKITFCLVITDTQNNLATTSVGLPGGTFSINLATSTTFGGSIVQTKTWNSSSFSPNTRIILLSGQDAECVTFDNLHAGTYYYSTVSLTGASWNTALYNDQFSQSIASTTDFYSYSPELFNATTSDDSLRNVNADGQIVLGANSTRTLVVLEKYNKETQCLLPQITSSLSVSTTVNQAFTYALQASSTPLATFAVSTSSLPAGLSFATSTNTISGTPTETGTFNIALSATNMCGIDTETLALTVLGITSTTTPNANLSLTKIADKTTANAGDTVTYTITLINHGPNTATSTTVTDLLPNQLNFVSASSTSGTYSTTTGIWTVGDMLNGSSTTLTLVTIIKLGTEGQKITNTAVASSTVADSNTANNSGSADVTVNNSTTGGGGGGGNTGGGETLGADLSLTKIVDKTTANVGDTLIYTITLTNHGPLTASSTAVSDVLPSTLSFLGASSTLGSYSTTTGMWIIGDLANGSSTTLTLRALINSGTAGQKITNTAVASSTQADAHIDNNTSTVDMNVNNPTTGGGGNTGGGGGGNGPIVGSFGNVNNGGGGNGPIIPSGGQVLGTSTESVCYYLHDYLRKDFNNNPVEVTKLQTFLKYLEGFSNLQITGVYDDQTIAAVNAFQIRYKDDVLLPWGYSGTEGTSYTYILTKKKVNEIFCKKAFHLTNAQAEEIAASKAFFESLKSSGIDTHTYEGNGQSNHPGNGPVVLPVDGGENNQPQVGTTSSSIGSSLSKKLQNLAFALAALPGKLSFGHIGSAAAQCLVCYSIFGKFNLILILIIIVLCYLWYREVNRNRSMDDINKQIDLDKDETI